MLTIQSRLSPPVPDVSMDSRPQLTGLIVLHGVSACCRILRARVVGELGLQSGNEDI
jgi:hypothetical protein